MKTLLEKFLEHTEIKEKDCWLWKGATASIGYGHLRMKGKDLYAHRVSYELFKLVQGEIPKGMCVCHSCDNPPCVNPEHLFLGSYKENANDRDKKGRNGSYKLRGKCSMSEENKQKLRLRMLGNKGYWLGKARSEETKIKISEALKGKNHRKKV